MLRVVPALDQELKRSPRLSSKFHWASVVTDDGPMASLAAEFEIPVAKTIDLLKIIYEEGRASLQEIKDAVTVIEGRDDIPGPKEFWKKYSLYFESGKC